MLNLLYQTLIAVGITIAGVLIYLWRQARSASQLNLALIRLNEQYQFDVPSFLQHAWPLLKQSGLRGFAWKLDWYGVMINAEHGRHTGEHVTKEIVIGDMQANIDFYQNQRGEKRYFDTALIETFILLLRTDMWIKAGAVDTTMSQMAKLTLFLEHDMKNVAQFIQLMSDQLEKVTPEKEAQLLQYLRRAAPMIRQRADHIVKTLTLKQDQEETAHLVQLDQVLHRLCHLYQLDYSLRGQAKMRILENTFENAMENILKNYHDMHQRQGGEKPQVHIEIAQEEAKTRIYITSANAVQIQDIERLFEPFWSNYQDGLGIGLYQAKYRLERCHATIVASKTPTGQVQFVIEMNSL